MALRTRCFGMTDVGRTRQKNEDNYIFVPGEGLYIVADGMGGHASGRLASTLAIKHITEFVCVQCKQTNFQWPYGYSEQTPHEDQLLSSAIRHANERIYIEACKDPAHEGMGTTLVAIFDGGLNHLHLAHVGDSRIYRYRDNTSALITEDHSLVNHLVRTGKLTPEQAENYPNKNVIFRALGLKDDVQVELQKTPKRAGDIYLMCSDGFSDVVEEDTMAEVLNSCRGDLKAACKAFINIANQNGGPDNITVLLLAIENT